MHCNSMFDSTYARMRQSRSRKRDVLGAAGLLSRKSSILVFEVMLQIGGVVNGDNFK